MEDKLFTVIMTAYNEEKNIEKALDSLLENELNNFNIIVVNDGSTDRTLEILREYEKSYENILVIDQENQGLSAARNVGVANVQTKYFFFHDSDDFLDGDAIQILTDLVNSHPEADLIKYNIKYVSKKGNIIRRNNSVSFEDVPGQLALKLLGFKDTMYYVSQLFVINTEYYVSNKFEFEVGRTHEDYGLIPFVIALAQDVVSTDMGLYNYCLTPNSISRSQDSKKVAKRAYDVLHFFKKGILWAEILENEEKITKECSNTLKQLYTNGLIEKAKEISLFLKSHKEYESDYVEFFKEIQKQRIYRYIKTDSLKTAIKKIMLSISVKMFAMMTSKPEQVINTSEEPKPEKLKERIKKPRGKVSE